MSSGESIAAIPFVKKPMERTLGDQKGVWARRVYELTRRQRIQQATHRAASRSDRHECDDLPSGAMALPQMPWRMEIGAQGGRK